MGQEDRRVESQTRCTKTVTIELSDGIVIVRSIAHQDQGFVDAVENLQICRELLDGASAPILIDIRQSGIVNRAARKTYASQGEYILAQAMLVDSAFARVAANLYIRVANPKHPTRMFNSEVDALRWLEGYLP